MESLTALDASSPTLLQTVRAHRGEVACVDARGARMVTGGGDRALRVWRWAQAEGWQELAKAPDAHRYGVTAARWSPGGALVASGGVDGVLRVWCARSLIARRVLAAPGAPAVRALCWAGAARVAGGHDDGAVCVWHVPNACLLARLHVHQGALHALAAPAQGAMLLTACTEGVLKVFDLQDVCRCAEQGLPAPHALSWVDNAHDMGALCACTSSDGRLAATGGHDARVRVWHVRSDAGVRRLEAGPTLEGHGAAVTSVQCAGGVLASASLDRTARLWARAGACLCVLHAHARYLSCVALAQDLRYLLTGSNDKSVRMWSLGALSLDGELEPPCAPHEHFGVGDLEGIGPVDNDGLFELEVSGDGGAEAGGCAGGARLAWRAPSQGAAVNCIAASRDLLATASSDGIVRIFRCNSDGSLRLEHTLGERGYPALAADFGAGGAVLLTGGLDGTAQLWDVETGVMLRSLAPPAVAEGDTGGGGVRAARVSPHRPPLLLLATDDGTAPLWSLADPDPRPIHVYGGHPEAAVCCAWSADGLLAASGGAGGELRLHLAPPSARTACTQLDAHDLGVQSCDFAPTGAVALSESEGAEAVHLLATGGSDGFIKLWLVEIIEDLAGTQVTMQLTRTVEAHGGGVTCVRWGPTSEGQGGAVLASGGAERWARVWVVTAEGGKAGARAVGAVPAAGAGGAAATAILDGQILAVGSLSGELALWQLPALPGAEGGGAGEEAEEDSEGEGEDDADVGAAPRWWRTQGVARWLREHVTRVPGASVSREEEALLLQKAHDANVTGSQLLDEPLDELLGILGYGAEADEDIEAGEVAARAETRMRIAEELKWLRRDSPPPELAWSAPHSLLCPLSHRLLREPTRAADGCTYERTALHEWFLAADGAVSGVSGRRLRNGRVQPNLRARDKLRAFLMENQTDVDKVT